MSIGTLFIVAVVVLAVVLTVRERRAVASRSPRGGASRPDLSVPELVATLRRGALPSPVPVGFPLRPGETCVGVVEADVEQWLEGDGTYVSKHVGWAGGLAGLAIGSALTAAGNVRRRSAAAREAAERWRLVGRYRIYVTTERIAMEGGSREWVEFWLGDLRQISLEDGTVVIQSAGGSPATRIHASPAAYWSVLLRRLAFAEQPSPVPGGVEGRDVLEGGR